MCTFTIFSLVLSDDDSILLLQSHSILMEHILTLYKKSLTINELSSPVDVLISGLRHKEKLNDSLSAISKLIEDKESCNILNEQNLLNEVKLSFECHMKKENKVVRLHLSVIL